MAPQVGTPEQWAEVRSRWNRGESVEKCADGFPFTGSTVSRRAKREGWVRDDGVVVAAAVAQTEVIKAKAGERWAQRRAELLDELVDDLFQIKAQLFAPVVKREAKVIGVGNGVQNIEIVDVPFDQPPVADQKAIAVTFAILADKTLLLAGEATSRAETGPIDRETAEARVQQIRDDLAERRAIADATREAM